MTNTPLAEIVRKLAGEGVSTEAIADVIACAELHAKGHVSPVDSQAERRRAADRERQRAKREAIKSADNPQTSADESAKKAPPMKNNLTPPKKLPPIPNGIPTPDEVRAAFGLWNETAEAHDLPRCQKISDTRRKAMRNRLKDCGGLDGFKTAMAKVGQIPGLLGENDRGWKADIDWLLKDKSFTGLMEGKYDHWGTGPPKSADGMTVAMREWQDEIDRKAANGRTEQDQDCTGNHVFELPQLKRITGSG